MKKRGRPCNYCSHPGVREGIAGLVRKNRTIPEICAELNLEYQTAYRHITKHVRPALAKETPTASSAPPAKDVGPAATDKEKLEAHVEWLRGEVRWAKDSGADIKSLALISREYMSASKMLRRMNGAEDISQIQIVRSQPFKAVMATIRTVLEKYPDALLAIDTALHAAEEQGRL